MTLPGDEQSAAPAAPQTSGRKTLCTELGRSPKRQGGIVNPPVYHASTVVFPTVEDLAFSGRKSEKMHYGRLGTPTTMALEEAVAGLEGGYRSHVVPSGLSAATAALLSVLRSGDRLLMVDSVYSPVRDFCKNFLRNYGVETVYYDPAIDAAGLEALLQEPAAALYLESPGSLTFEVQDVPALCEVAHRHNVVTIMDNTWASPYFFKPFDHGVDISVQAGTKYIVGHSDAMMGLVTTNQDTEDRVRSTIWGLGLTAGPDDCYLALRGIRTLGVRLEAHQKNTLEMAHWLEEREEVAQVLYPALPSHPRYEIWKRDFLGASGLLGLVLRHLKGDVDAGIKDMLEGMRYFSMGYSFGGFESLVTPTKPENYRSATTWAPEGPCLRLHIGLEDTEDLKRDLDAGFARLLRHCS